MEKNWTYAELIDLEYCLNLDQDKDQAALHERDRQILLNRPQTAAANDRTELIAYWLQQRKEQIFGLQDARSPGQITSETYRTLSFTLSICGVFLGIGAGLSFLAYSGTTPVNVLHFLFLFIFSQLLIIALIVPAVFLRLAGITAVPAPIVSIYASISSRFAGLSAHIPAEKRAAYAQVSGIWKKQHSRYQRIAYWPFFSLSQYTMTGFNLGLLTATVYKLMISDIAFGWQSTIQFSTDFIHKLVCTLALPWSWVVPDPYACPSAAEIEGSRIVLKEGIYHLATQDLVSWWPFLVCCIIVYGVIFRIVLTLIGRIGRNRSLRSVRFNTPALLQLAQRMQSPLVSSQADPAAAPVVGPEPVTAQAGGTPVQTTRVLLLVPEETAALNGIDRFADYLGAAGFTVTEYRLFMTGYEADQELVETCGALDWPEGAGIAVIIESWMPPIRETLTFFSALREAIGTSVPIFVVPIGQSHGEVTGGVPAKPTEADRQIWQQKLDALADPYTALMDMNT